jgi:RNA-directed DNA polymerase
VAANADASGSQPFPDRVVQAALKIVLEPIFEADFQPCSYEFRPGRRTQDAIAEIHYLTSRSYEWVVEADIEACFDRIDHQALMGRVRARVGDKRVRRLITAFLKAGIMTEHGDLEASLTGTPQGGILAPLLANIALSTLDEHFAQAWAAMGANSGQRQTRRPRGEPTYRLVRYANDFVILVSGERRAEGTDPEGDRAAGTEAVGGEDPGRAQRRGVRVPRLRHSALPRPTGRRHVYTYPSRPSLEAVMRKIKAQTRTGHDQTLDQIPHRLNPVLRAGAPTSATECQSAPSTTCAPSPGGGVICWLRRKHPKANWRWMRATYLPFWWPTHNRIELYNPGGVAVTRYRYRGKRIPTPWQDGQVRGRDRAVILERVDNLIRT